MATPFQETDQGSQPADSHHARKLLSQQAFGAPGDKTPAAKAPGKQQSSTAELYLPGFHLDHPAVAGQTTHATIEVDGKEREAWIHVPKGLDPKKPTPLLVVMNGVGPAGTTTESLTGMSPRADKDGFIAVYLQGESFQHGYNNGQKPFNNGDDDVKYIKSVVDTLENDKKELTIDKSRVGLMGFSSGGSEAYLAATQLPVSSVITMEGWEGQGGQWDKAPLPGTSLLSFRGQDDRIVRPGGTPQMAAETEKKKAAVELLTAFTANPLAAEVVVDTASAINHKLHGDAPVSATVVEAASEYEQLHGTYVQPEQHTVDRYVQADQITQPAQVSHNGNITIAKYSNPSTGAAVEQVDIAHGQHALNGSTDHHKDQRLIGTPTNEISTPDMAADFFMSHPRKTSH